MPRIDFSEEAKFCFFYYKVVETYSILALLQSPYYKAIETETIF